MESFDNQKYKQLQKQAIFERIHKFGKLYMEVGGKLFDDNHAARVLPGFEADVKMQIFREIKSDLEVLFCVNAQSIILGKARGDNKLSYADETLRLIENLSRENFAVIGIMITFYEKNPLVFAFEERCTTLGIKTFHSYYIENYPNDIDRILSPEGFGKNDYVQTTKNLVLVCAPGANSGKLQTCFSQIYHDAHHGIRSCYAKYETFPVWNLPLNHLVNIAYEMSTVDIGDRNEIDPFYSAAHGGEPAVNYNRDIESFPILSKILTHAVGHEVYNSPTEMGINMVGFAIIDDKAVQRAAYEEIVRRHEKHKQMYENKKLSKLCLNRSEQLLLRAEALLPH